MPARTATAAAGANGTAQQANGHAGKSKLSRSALKRQKAKQKAKAGADSASVTASESEAESDAEVSLSKHMVQRTHLLTLQSVVSNMTVESFLDVATPDPSDANFSQFANVFKHFNEVGEDGLIKVDDGPAKGQVYYSDDDEDDEETIEARKQRALAEEGLTRRERRRAAKLTVSELKQLVDRPEVVEWFDCDARDPRLLVTLKSYRK